jgi:hypothetical protein
MNVRLDMYSEALLQTDKWLCTLNYGLKQIVRILDASLWILDIEKDRFRILSPQGGTYASLQPASPLMRDFRFAPTGIEHPASRSLVGFPASIGTGRRSFAMIYIYAYVKLRVKRNIISLPEASRRPDLFLS